MLTRVFPLLPVLFVMLCGMALPGATRAQERAVPESAPQMQLSFAPVVKKVAPAVVNIYTKRTVSQSYRNPFMDDPFFAPFFRDDFFGGRMRRQVESALGSGAILEPDGLVVTNAHVVRGAEEITVVLADGREFGADLALVDDPSDLALLRMQDPPADLPHVTLKPSETLEVGDLVLAIGNPFAVGQTVTSGIVSALARSSLNINDFNFFIQTDAAINPGNSGGPLVALDGGVVGINTAIYSRSGGSLGIGFAIPSEMVASVVAAEKMGRTGGQGVARPWLGVTAQTVTADIAASLGLEKPGGALISALHSASPLRKAGLRPGDVVLGMNGRALRDAGEMKFRMATVPLGRKAELKVYRNGAVETYHVTAMTPPDEPPRRETVLSGSHALSGVRVANLNPAVSVELGLTGEEDGVVVLEVPARALLRIVSPGDILRQINGRDIATVKDAEEALQERAGQGLILLIESGGRIRRVMVR